MKRLQHTETESNTNLHKGRTGQDSDMASCILFLAGPGGLFFNAQVLYPDGGKVLASRGEIRS